MSRSLFCCLCLLGCAGPDASRAPAESSVRSPHAPPAARARAGAVLSAESPLGGEAVPAPVVEFEYQEGVDPICGMKVDPATAKGGQVTHGGHTWSFCSRTCRDGFLKQTGAEP